MINSPLKQLKRLFNFLDKLYWEWRHRKTLPPISTSRIMTRACSLRLKGKAGEKFLVRMTSGEDAVYVYTRTRRNQGLDWHWWDYSFKRYAKTIDKNLPRWC